MDGALIGEADLPVAEADLPALIAQLPAEVREVLAKGPMRPGENDDDCRVCAALDSPWLPPARPWAHAGCLVHDFHTADGSYGEAAYRRCVAVYRAAGWTGVDDPRDQHGFEGDDG